MQSIGHDLRRGLNNFSTGNYKHINKWLAELKNIDSSLKTLDKEISTNAKLISAWGCNEGDDLTDVCQRMTQLMEEIGLIQQAYSIQHTAYRKRIKSLKTQEMLLDDNRKKKHDLTNQIAKQQKASKENPIKMMELQNNLDRVSAELLGQELDLLQFKRQTIRDAFNCQFDSMIEYSEKMALIAGYGRQITNVIDCGPQPAERTSLYCGAEYTAAAINQVKIAVTSWQAQPVGNPIRAHIAPAEEELALSAAATAYNNRTPPMNGHRQSNGQGFVNGAPESPGNWEEVRMLNLGASQASLNESQGAAEQDHWKKEVLGSVGQEEQYYPPTDPTPEASPYITSLQINQLQEQQRHLQMEQQRVYQNNQSMYSPSPSPSPTNQQSYHHTAASVAASLRKSSIDTYGNGSMAGAPGAGSSNGRPFTPTMLRRNDTSEFGSSGSASPGPSHNGGYGQHQPSSYEDNVSTARGGYRRGFTDPRERSRMDNSDLYKTEITTSSRYSKNSVIMDEK
ncbi:MAG: Eisosome component PIL1-domain-containing protein [Linnemannia elongata]|nr:MAG: Eisosome component PIL1-domain-containing protein [Linnemannia elongata]